ncbi:hypothetical protein ACWEWU_10765 [Staphylococcus xylosus]
MNKFTGNYILAHPTDDYIIDEYVFENGDEMTTFIYSDNTVITQVRDSQGRIQLHSVNRDTELQSDGKTVLIVPGQ